MSGLLTALSILLQLTVATASQAKNIRNFSLVHIIPGDSTNYTVSRELVDLEQSARLAIQDFRLKHPDCEFKQAFYVRTGSEKDLFNTVSTLSKTAGKKVAVGFSRSSLARVAARASRETDLVGVSVGAAAEDLHELNPNFVTVASSWRKQWEVISQDMSVHSCTPEKTLVVSDLKDSYSYNFLKAAQSALFHTNVDVSELEPVNTLVHRLSNYKCIFMAMNMSTSQGLITRIVDQNWQGTIYGTGDWLYYSGELTKLSLRFAANLRLAVPTGWDQAASLDQAHKVNRIQKVLNHEPAPNSIYSYDAVILGLNYLCLDLKPNHFDKVKFEKLGLIREYRGLAASGNYLSPVFLKVIHGPK